MCQGLLFWITAPEMPIKSPSFQALLPWLQHHGYDSIATALLFHPCTDTHTHTCVTDGLYMQMRAGNTFICLCKHEHETPEESGRERTPFKCLFTCILYKGVTTASHYLSKNSCSSAPRSSRVKVVRGADRGGDPQRGGRSSSNSSADI